MSCCLCFYSDHFSWICDLKELPFIVPNRYSITSISMCKLVCFLLSTKDNSPIISLAFPILSDLRKQMNEGGKQIHSSWPRPSFPMIRILSQFSSPHHCKMPLERLGRNTYWERKKRKRERKKEWGGKEGRNERTKERRNKGRKEERKKIRERKQERKKNRSWS